MSWKTFFFGFSLFACRRLLYWQDKLIRWVGFISPICHSRSWWVRDDDRRVSLLQWKFYWTKSRHRKFDFFYNLFHSNHYYFLYYYQRIYTHIHPHTHQKKMMLLLYLFPNTFASARKVYVSLRSNINCCYV